MYLYFSVLVVGLYEHHWHEITELVSITLLLRQLVYICYILVPYKWNKEKVIITFRSYVRNMLGSCVRLTLGSYLTKLCKWDQNITL